MAILAEEHPDSPISVDGVCPHGDFLIQYDLEVTYDEGPAPEIEEIVITWTASPEAMQLNREKQERERQQGARVARRRPLP